MTPQPDTQPPLLPTARYPPPNPSELNPKNDDDWLDHQPLIDDPDHEQPPHHNPRTKPRSSPSTSWRRVWSLLGVCLGLLLVIDLGRGSGWLGLGKVNQISTAKQIVYTDKVNQTALAKHFGYNPTEKVVVLYVYHDSDDALANAKFFIAHALHDRADFIFILNGETTLTNLIPTDLPNIRVVQRGNDCYDLGAHGEVLQANDRELVKKYDKFVLMNASVRGPFMPRWSRDCWTDAFTNRVTDTVKLVGLTMNCLDGIASIPYRPGLQSTAEGMDDVHKLRHLQAMMLATDRIGVDLLLDPLGLDACHSDYDLAVASEVRLTMLVEHGGYEVDALMSMYGEADDFAETCTAPDPMEAYPGGYLPLHETLFAKTKKLPADVVARYSDWAKGYSSYEACARL